MRHSARILSLLSAAAVAVEMMAGPLSPALTGSAASYAAEGFSLAESGGDETVYEYDYEYAAETDADSADVTKERPEVYETVEINSVEDFLVFAENCHYDGWSLDKSVVLNADLDFSGTTFESAASFGGLFDGQGHTIRGIRITDYVDETGVFGTIQNTGVVANVNIEGLIAPAGSQSTLGGIAGINYGTISNCTFTGSIEADSEIGGIAGRNGLTGIVIGCSAAGTLNATSGSGGIVGYNEGTISSCVNEAEVNTIYQDSTIGLDELTDVLEAIELSGSIFNTGELSSHSDIGGIAGFSSGVITSCTNRGTVGYQHVGYNVGGIVGRSSGFLYRNENYGSIYGRKDVGGIAGQIQPYVTLSFTQETLDELSQEIDALQDAISQAMDSAGTYGDAVSSHLTNLSGLAQIAEDSVSDIASEAADIYDDASEKINDATTTLQSVLGTFSSVGDSLDGYLENVTGSFGDLGDYMEEYFGGISDSVQSLLASLRAVFSFGSSYDLTGSSASSALSELESLLEELLSGYETDSFGSVEDESAEDPWPGDHGTADSASAAAQGEEKGASAAAQGEEEGASAAAQGTEEGGSKTWQESEAESGGEETARQGSAAASYGSQEDRSTDAGNSGGQGGNDLASAEELAEFAQRAQAAAEVTGGDSADSSSSDGEGSAPEAGTASSQGSDSESGSAASTTQESGSAASSSQESGSADLVAGTDDQEETGESSSEGSKEQQDAADFAGELQDYQGQIEELDALSQELAEYAEAVSQWEDDGEISTLLGSILSGIRSLTSSLTSMRGILSSYDTSSSVSLKGLFAELSDALDAIGDSPDILSEISDALDALASIDLHLNGVSDSLRTSGDTLYESISQILSEFEALNQDLGDMMDSVGDDFSVVGDRIDDLMDTLIGSAEGVMNAEFLDAEEDSFQDVSDEEMEEGYQGRTSACTNYGTVSADVNVGGIAGMIGVEYSLDPELDIETSGSTTLNYVFRARCIVDNCDNRGTVMAGTSGGGGIAGRMEMGLVAYCENYGALDCEGKYIGGIAGYSAGTIRDCTARCDLSGTTYIGGIAGYGTTLRRNLSMVNVLESEQYVGAIAGRVGDLDEIYVYENYYYSESIFGIDGVSYEGIAERVSYEELASMDALPEGFDALTLTFVVEDEILEVITCAFGASLSASEIPEIPEREGFYSEWSRTEFDAVTADEIITATYYRITTLLTSEEKRGGGQSIVCVDGAFRQGDALVLRAEEAQSGELERWTVVIPEGVDEAASSDAAEGALGSSDEDAVSGAASSEADADSGSDTDTVSVEESSGADSDDSPSSVHQIRYLVPDDISDASLVQIYLIAEDGSRTKVSTSTFSSYLIFEAEGDTVTFAAESVLSKNNLLPILLGCAGAAAVIVLLARLIRRRKRKRLAAAEAAADAGDWEEEDV